MTEVILFHHVMGLTDGVSALADAMRRAGHTVYVPDLFGGSTFTSVEDGFEFQRSVDDVALADAAVAELSGALVYVGLSWGVPPAQRLAQTRPGALGAVLIDACVPVTGAWAFGPWP